MEEGRSDDVDGALAAQVEQLSEQVAELSSNLQTVMAENEQLTKLVTADASLAAAVKMIKELQRVNATLQERNNGLMDEKNQAIRAARKAQSDLAKLQKQVAT
jgi:protein subunit release factor A